MVDQKSNGKVKTWMLVIVIILGSIIGGIIASLLDVALFQKYIKRVWTRFGIMLAIAIVISSTMYFLTGI